MTGGDGDQDSADFELLFEMDGTAQSVSCMRCGVNYQAGNTLTVPVPALASLGITNPITLTVDTVATVNGIPGVITGVSVSSKWPDPIVILPTWHVSTTALNADLLFDFSKVRTYYDNVMKGTQTDAGLALADFRAGSQTWFRQWDANGDGKLVKDELTADMPRDGSSCVRQATLKCPKGKQLVDGAMKKANVCEACPSGKFSNADDDKPCGLHTVTGWATVASGAVCGSSWNIPELINMPNSGVKNFGPKTLDACKQACVDLGAECGAISHGNGATDRLVQSCFLHRTQTLTDRTYAVHGGVSLTGYTCLHRVHNCAPGKGLQKGTASADGVCISCGAGAVCIDTRASGSGLEGDDNRGSYTNGVSSQCEYFKSKNQCGTVGEGAWGAACLKTCGLCVASWDFSAADDDKPCSTFTPSCGVGLGVVAGTATASVDRQCETCPPGKFSTADDANACVFFTVVKCGVGLGTVAGTATSSVDRQCESCPTGKFSAAGDTYACASFTVTKCGVGEGVVAGTAAASVDRQCESCPTGCRRRHQVLCPTGKFSAADDANACGSFTGATCGVGEGVVAGTATASADRQCESCQLGKFSTGWAVLTSDSYCNGGNLWHDKASTIVLSNNECRARCVADSSCNFYMWRYDTGASADARYTCAGFGTCASTARFDDGDGGNIYVVGATACASFTVTKCGVGLGVVAGTATASVDRQCESCPTGKFSAADDVNACGSFTVAKCGVGEGVVAGTATASADRQCGPCPSGKFSAVLDATACGPHTTVQTGCPVGKQLVAGTASTDIACATCPSGKFSASNDPSLCEPYTVASCAVGKGMPNANPSTEDRVCTACASGKYSQRDDATPCYSHAVTKCIPGKELSAGTDAKDGACAPCGVGKFSAADDAEKCVSYVGPVKCVAGKELVPGSSSKDRICQTCPSGRMSTTDDDAACQAHAVADCIAGKGMLTVGTPTVDGVCIACSPGQFSAAVDTNGCAGFTVTTCPKGAGVASGTATPTTDRECRLCNSGTFSATADDQACKSYTVGACLPGKGLSVATAASDRSCSPCAPGTFSAANDANVCTSYTGPSSCALGEGLQYSATSNRACVPCAGGSFSAANDGNTCVPHTVTNCGAGKGLSKGSVTADGVCAPCGPGNFNAFYDDNGCAAFAGPTQCPAGAGLFSGSASADRSCT